MMTSSKFTKLATSLLLSTIVAPAAMAGGGHMSSPGFTPDLLPANPNAGMCYARVEIPAQYDTTSEDVLVEEGYQTLEVRQPQLRRSQKQVLVKEASVRYEVRQPSFRSVSEQVMVAPAYDKLTVTPPKFSSVTETLTASAPRLVWKRGNPGKLMSQGYKIHSTADAGVGGRGYSSTTQYGATGGAMNCGPTCEIWCLVEEPGESVNYNRKVLSQPARVTRHQVPARYQSVMKQVVSDPGGVREIPVPAQHRMISVEEMVDPGGERMVNVPPKYGKVAKKVLIAPERYEWRQVVCKPGSQRSMPNYTSVTTNVVTPTHTYSAPVQSHVVTPAYSSSTAMPMAPTVNDMRARGVKVCNTHTGQHCGDMGGHSAYEGRSWNRSRH